MRPTESTRGGAEVFGGGLRLGAGVDVLDEWAATAHQIDLNAVQDALFALLERSVDAHYEVIDDAAYPRHLVVVVRDELALRVELHDVGTFGIEFIGTPVDALAPFGDSTS